MLIRTAACIKPRFVSGLSSLQAFWSIYSCFSVIYRWALNKDHHVWRYSRLATPIISSAGELAALVSLMTGWKLGSIRRLLLEVSRKGISRLRDNTNDNHRALYRSPVSLLYYVIITLRMTLELGPRAAEEYVTKHRTNWYHLHQHQ